MATLPDNRPASDYVERPISGGLPRGRKVVVSRRSATLPPWLTSGFSVPSPRPKGFQTPTLRCSFAATVPIGVS
jgi:hypothetical protein